MSLLPAWAASSVFCLLDNGDIAIVSTTTRIIPTVSSSREKRSGHLLALSPDGRRLYALIGAKVAVIDLDSPALEKTISLPDPERLPSTITVGRKSGQIYVFYPGRIVVLSPGSGMILHDWSTKRAEPADWGVYSAAVSDDEVEIYLSYHGGDRTYGPATSGIDWFTVKGDNLIRCDSGRTAPTNGCLNSHGHVATGHGSLILATGTQYLITVDGNQTPILAYDTELTGNHLMEFAVSDGGRYVWAVGSCFYTGGLSGIPIGDRSTAGNDVDIRGIQLPVSSVRPAFKKADLCGERVAVSRSGDRVAVATIRTPNAVTSEVSLVDTSNGAVRSIPLPGVIRDLVIN